MSYPDKEALPFVLTGNGGNYLINIETLLLVNIVLCYPGDIFPLVINGGESG